MRVGNNMDEKFTIITTSYNYQDYIGETINSVINQTYNNWEMVIVNDGSKDNSVEVIKSYCKKDSRIRLYQHENGVNKGIVETMKLGISKANTEWIVFLESDDIITPDYLEKKLEIIHNNSDISFIFNKAELFGDERAVHDFDEVMEQQRKIINNRNIVGIIDFKTRNIVITFSCVTMKKSLFNDIDFNTPVKQWLDYYLWLQVATKTKLYYIDEPLTKWRMHYKSYNNRKTDDKLSIDFDFVKLQFIYPKLPKIFIYLILAPRYLKLYRKKIIRLSFRDKYFTLFGKTFTKNSP